MPEQEGSIRACLKGEVFCVFVIILYVSYDPFKQLRKADTS